MTQSDTPGSLAAWNALERRLQATLHELAASRAAVAGLRRQLSSAADKTAALSDRLAAVQDQVAGLSQQRDREAAHAAVLSGELAAAREALQALLGADAAPPAIPLVRLRQTMRRMPGWSIVRAIVRYSRRPG